MLGQAAFLERRAPRHMGRMRSEIEAILVELTVSGAKPTSKIAGGRRINFPYRPPHMFV
jgi:hypothetical protein